MKTFISTVSVVFLCASLNAQLPPPGEFIRGDVDFDFAVLLTDAIIIGDHLFEGLPIPFWGCDDAYDADDSGVINITDMIYIVNYLFQGGPQPPHPFPSLGHDLTDDSLTCSSLYESEVEFIRGDVNQDGLVIINDASLLSVIVANQLPYGPCPMALDVNVDGYIDSLDVTYLVNYLTAQGPPPPPPSPFCGHDFAPFPCTAYAGCN